MVDDLRGRGVMTGLVRTAKGVSTGAAYITVTPDGENTIVLDPGANALRRFARGCASARKQWDATRPGKSPHEDHQFEMFGCSGVIVPELENIYLILADISANLG
jgi:hypothetical protein